MRVVTLLSDFGLRDGYVAEMKETILDLCPVPSSRTFPTISNDTIFRWGLSFSKQLFHTFRRTRYMWPSSIQELEAIEGRLLSNAKRHRLLDRTMDSWPEQAKS